MRFAILSLLVTAIAAISVPMVEMEKFVARSDFTRLAQPAAETEHEVVFAVAQKNLDKLEAFFFEVSDPKSSKYGKYLNRHEVANMTSNSVATEFVSKYLNENGVKLVKTTPYGEYITAKATVAQWEKLLATTFYTFSNGKKTVVRSTDYSLPQELAQHVSSVFNTVQLPPQLSSRLPAKLSAKGKTGSITPDVLNTYYGVTSNVGNNKGSQAVFESLEQYYSPNDLTQFEQTYGVPVEAVTTDIGGYVSDDKCVEDANNCVEANLDVQYLIAISQVTPTTYWYEDATDSFLAWIQAVAASDNPPLVNSISYGAIETSVPKSIGNAFNTEAMKLGAQGVSVLVSSGDDGVANFQARHNPKSCGYTPSFPASSPYVTAVGATQGPESGTTEIACTSATGGGITTGGGFSTLFTSPSYQKSAVAGYFAGLTKAEQPVSGYATTGRGYPDIAMAGFNYEVVVGGKTYQVSGTSASSPVTAGFVALVNAARLAAGKPALGFLNPAIYQNGASFANDVTSGENNCAASNVCCDQGFYATKGWDPLTGFGSVDYKKFYNIFYNL